MGCINSKHSNLFANAQGSQTLEIGRFNAKELARSKQQSRGNHQYGYSQPHSYNEQIIQPLKKPQIYQSRGNPQYGYSQSHSYNEQIIQPLKKPQIYQNN